MSTATANINGHHQDPQNMTGNPYCTVNLDNSIPVNTGMSISRGIRPDAIIDWDRLNGLFVLNELGNKIRFTDIFKKQKTIVFFIRVSSMISIFQPNKIRFMC